VKTLKNIKPQSQQFGVLQQRRDEKLTKESSQRNITHCQKSKNKNKMN
jgi:hypothetical protein